MLGMQIVIEKNRVVGVGTEQLQRPGYVVGNVDEIAAEAFLKPFVPSFIVFEQKDTNRMALRRNITKPQFIKQ